MGAQNDPSSYSGYELFRQKVGIFVNIKIREKDRSLQSISLDPEQFGETTRNLKPFEASIKNVPRDISVISGWDTVFTMQRGNTQSYKIIFTQLLSYYCFIHVKERDQREVWEPDVRNLKKYVFSFTSTWHRKKWCPFFTRRIIKVSGYKTSPAKNYSLLLYFF